MSVDPRAGSNNTGAGLPEEAAEGGYHFLYKFMVSHTLDTSLITSVENHG